MAAAPPRDLGERTFQFACETVIYCRELPKESGQEAKGAYSRREFAARNGIVLKELKESKLWYRIIIRCNLGPQDEPIRLVKEADELVAMLTAGMKRLNPVAGL
jgi:hypothetical protein